MASVYDTIYSWARKTTTSFAELLVSERPAESLPPEPGELIFRLKQWPELPSSLKNADVLRTLSVMSNRPVNRRWILKTSRLKPRQVDQLIALLVRTEVVEVIDTSRFEGSK